MAACTAFDLSRAARCLLISAVMAALVSTVSGLHAPFLGKFNFPEKDEPFTIYYEPRTRRPFRMTAIRDSIIGGGRPPLRRQVALKANGCNCNQLTCGCCLGVNLQQYNFNREGCVNFIYDPNEFSITMNMLWNNQQVYTNTISARNPPPLCVPLQAPVPLPAVEFCGKLFDVRTPDGSLHMCFDFETRLQKAAVLILHFDCMQMGGGGVQFFKPGQQANTTATPAQTTEMQVDVDVYDEVTEIKTG